MHRRAASDRSDAAVDRAGAAPAEEVSTLGLETALQALPRGGKARVLDLGAASGSNLSFLSPYCRTVTLAELELPLTLGREQEILPPSSGPYDLILAWDLVNYLDKPAFEVLYEALRPRCRRGTALFFSVYYTADMPARPGLYRIRSTKSLSYTPRARARRPSPRYKEPELLRLLPGFEVERVFLLRHGVEEYVLRHA